MKKKFKLVADITVSVYTEVEAETLEEAIQISEMRDMCEIHVDGTYAEDEYWICSELDGAPQRIEEAFYGEESGEVE